GSRPRRSGRSGLNDASPFPFRGSPRSGCGVSPCVTGVRAGVPATRMLPRKPSHDPDKGSRVSPGSQPARRPASRRGTRPDRSKAVDVRAMLGKCEREQWSLGDLDWSVAPRAMSRADEMAIVQYFTDMAGIERLAMSLFEEQARKAADPTLQKIFRTF